MKKMNVNFTSISEVIFVNNNQRNCSNIRSFHEEWANCACLEKLGVRRLVCKDVDSEGKERRYCVWEEIACENCKNKYRIEHYVEPSDEFTQMDDAILILKDLKIDKKDNKIIHLAQHLKFQKKNR